MWNPLLLDLANYYDDDDGDDNEDDDGNDGYEARTDQKTFLLWR